MRPPRQPTRCIDLYVDDTVCTFHLCHPAAQSKVRFYTVDIATFQFLMSKSDMALTRGRKKVEKEN